MKNIFTCVFKKFHVSRNVQDDISLESMIYIGHYLRGISTYLPNRNHLPTF